jgi:hypothetical protein
VGFRKDKFLEPINKEALESQKENLENQVELHKQKTLVSPVVKIDRVVLDVQTTEVLKVISSQAQKALGDLIEVSQKEIINFILQERSHPLSEIELKKLREQNFDMVKALQHATERAKKAKTAGREISLDDILKYIQTPIVIEKEPSISLRGRKRKSEAGPAPDAIAIDRMSSLDEPKKPIKDILNKVHAESKSENIHKFLGSEMS